MANNLTGRGIMNKLEADQRKKFTGAAEEIAQLFYDRLRDNILKNSFGFALKNTTLAIRKQRGIKSRKPLYATGEYFNAIQLNGTKVNMVRGFHTDSGLSYRELFYVLEYGRKDRSVPAFPVWRMTAEEIKPEIQEIIKRRTKAKKK